MRIKSRRAARRVHVARPHALRDVHGFSRVELICGIGIGIALLALIVALGSYMLNDMQRGDDSITLHTAKTCASIDATGSCLVPDCPGTDTPVHKTTHIDSNGYNFAYFDKVANCLTDERSTGYNEATVTDLDNKSYAPSSAIVRVENHDGDIICDWVLGR